MSASMLADSVRYHAKTPIEVWDGSSFRKSCTLVNIKSAAHNSNVKQTLVMGTVGNDPLKGVFTFRDIAGQIFNIIERRSNTYQGVTYGTTYYIRSAPFKAKIYAVDTAKEVSGSGFSYDSESKLLREDWVLMEHDRYFNAPAPIARLGISQMFLSYLPPDIGVVKGVTVALDSGHIYEVVTEDHSVSRGVQCYLMLLEAKHASNN